MQAGDGGVTLARCVPTAACHAWELPRCVGVEQQAEQEVVELPWAPWEGLSVFSYQHRFL